jgi:hypothetical protein
MNQQEAPPASAATVSLVDAHVHIYDCFELDRLLDGAAGNFTTVARRHGIAACHCVLLLTETADDNAFRALAAGAASDGRATTSAWVIEATPEPETIVARRGGDELTIVAGRQVVSREKLEILALGTVASFEDGLPAGEAIAAIKAAGALPVLPWGVGKWWGGRGALTDSILEQTGPSEVLLGDNSGRPWFFPEPKQFRVAAATGRRILPGSDPLPFPGEAGRVGSVGSIVEFEWSESQPAAALKQALRDEATPTTPYMTLERLVPFARNQVGMQLRKRRR